MVAFLGTLAIGAGLRCDEACDGEGWRRSPDAWQWDALVGLGALVLIAGTALVVFVWRRRPAWATASLGLGLVAIFTVATMLSPDWVEHLDQRSREDFLPYAIGLGSAMFAVLLSGANGRAPSTR